MAVASTGPYAIICTQLQADNHDSTSPLKFFTSWMFFLMSNQQCHSNKGKTRMWANAQRDGRPAEYRWHLLFNGAVWLTPTTKVQCSNAAKHETR